MLTSVHKSHMFYEIYYLAFWYYWIIKYCIFFPTHHLPTLSSFNIFKYRYMNTILILIYWSSLLVAYVHMNYCVYYVSNCSVYADMYELCLQAPFSKVHHYPIQYDGVYELQSSVPTFHFCSFGCDVCSRITRTRERSTFREICSVGKHFITPQTY